MKSLWARVGLALNAHVPDAVAALRKGASEKAIHRLEAKLGAQLPADLKASLLVHDGQRPPYMSEVLFDNEYLLPCAQVASTWSMRNEVAADLREDESATNHTAKWWDPISIPVTDSDGNGFCVHRTTGAVHYHVHDGEMEGPLFDSWTDLLSDLADKVERGAFKVEHGGLWTAK